jgi:hypothetical protein
MIRSLVARIRSGRVWVAFYIVVSMAFTGMTYGGTGDARQCPLIKQIYIWRTGSPGEGIVVMTVFWPAVVVAAARGCQPATG